MANGPQEEEELRVDEADGLAYPLKDWCVQYGGTEENPPEQWLKAQKAPATLFNAPAPGSTFKAASSDQPSAFPEVRANEFEVENFIAKNALGPKVAGLLREQKPDVQAAVIAGGPMREGFGVRCAMSVMMTRIKRATGSGNIISAFVTGTLPDMGSKCLSGESEWNPNGGGAHNGVVHMWHDLKGYGFITDSTDGNQYFCHHTDIGGRSLIKDGIVTFDLGTNTNGTQKAINISGAVGPRKGKGFGEGKGFAPPYGGGRGGLLAPPSFMGGGGGPVDVNIEHFVIVPYGWMPGMNVRFDINGTKFSIPVPAGQSPGSQFQIAL